MEDSKQGSENGTCIPQGERFKVELNGLPKFFNVGDAKKLVVKKLGMKPRKFKPVGRQATWMFIYFNSDEECKEAIEKLQNYDFKGRKLRAFMAKAKKDPFFQQKNKDDVPEDTRPVAERIRSAVCAISHLPYEKQLESKMVEIKKVSVKLRREILGMLPVLKDSDVEVAKVEEIVPSPVIDHYRNKCEFTVGRHPETDLPTVGFRLASYKKGSVSVVGVEDLPIVSKEMKKAVKHFEEFIRESGYPPYNPVDKKGHWHQLTVRSNRKKELMVWAFFKPQLIDLKEQAKISESFKNHFLQDFGVNVTSLYFQFTEQRQPGQPESPIQHLGGVEGLTETLMGGKLSFEISPQSFFQVNVDAAEKLYETCINMADLKSDKTLLFDVCCGTGTIGLCMASRCRKVIGIDITEEAIENAKKNAERNGVINTEYHAGKAEHLLSELLKPEESSEEVVAIVDPPRAGLHIKAVTALRTSTNIKKVVYVSCDINAAYKSLIAMARPQSNTYRGDPFVPKLIVPVDLFPHTRHFELVMLFERMSIVETAQASNNT